MTRAKLFHGSDVDEMTEEINTWMEGEEEYIDEDTIEFKLDVSKYGAFVLITYKLKEEE